MWGCWVGAVSPLHGGGSCSLAERGVFIYYLWHVGSIPRTWGGDRREQGDAAGWGRDMEGPTGALPEHPGFVCSQIGAEAETIVGAMGAEAGLDGAGGPRTMYVSWRRGCMSASEDPTLAPSFSSLPHTAVQPLGSVSPSAAHWGWERWREERRVLGPPRGPGWRRTFTFTAF